MKTRGVSTLMLERYHLGEVNPEERELVKAELAADTELRLRYQALEDSDRELRRQYPALEFLRASKKRYGNFRYNPAALMKGLCAAAIFLCVLFPALHFMKARTSHGESIYPAQDNSGDRIKGSEIRTELSLYLKDNRGLSAIPSNEEHKLPDHTLLRAGSTVQLAYTTPPGAVYYGVIFSIDGRSVVTMHYPYRRGQNPILNAGKRTFLDESYTLDDAPDFEIFFMVVSQNPLDTEGVMRIAAELAGDPKTALAKISSAFSGCEVETITIQK